MIEERFIRYYVIKCENKRCVMVSGAFNTRKEAEEAYEKYWKPRNGLCTWCYEKSLHKKAEGK